MRQQPEWLWMFTNHKERLVSLKLVQVVIYQILWYMEWTTWSDYAHRRCMRTNFRKYLLENQWRMFCIRNAWYQSQWSKWPSNRSYDAQNRPLGSGRWAPGQLRLIPDVPCTNWTAAFHFAASHFATLWWCRLSFSHFATGRRVSYRHGLECHFATRLSIDVVGLDITVISSKPSKQLKQRNVSISQAKNF